MGHAASPAECGKEGTRRDATLAERSLAMGLQRMGSRPLGHPRDARPGLLEPRGPATAPVLLALAGLAATLPGCGAKTGLTVPDASPEPDAGVDGGICRPVPLDLERRGAQVVFVIDRSNSMRDTLDGRDPEPGEASRWEVLGQTLGEALGDADRLVEIGAKFYPRASDEPAMTPEEACTTSPGMDLVPARDGVAPLLELFRTTRPGGGTPTAAGLVEVRDYFEREPAAGVPRYVILATDGGPNCNPDTGVSPSVCLCTGQPEMCTDNVLFGPYNCLDEERTLAAVDALYADLGVPVYVIGIDDPNRGDLADVLDRMAVAGGRPRTVEGERRFYSVRRTADLRDALGGITDSIARCVFTVDPTPREGALVEVRIDGESVPRDERRLEGWDFTGEDRTELSLFGRACADVSSQSLELVAEIGCPAP
jgi:hypothetical protein